MTSCRSSRLFDCTRSSSPWICDLTVLGPSSRMILPIFLAFSWEMPSLSVEVMRYSLLPANGLARLEALERDAALDELRLEHVEHGLGALLGVRLDEDRLAAPLDRRPGALEVVALLDLFAGLVEGVVRLLVVDLADDVEG